MRKLVLSLAAAAVLSTMTAGFASAGPAKPMPYAELAMCTRTTEAGDVFQFTVSWEYLRNPYEVQLFGGSTSVFADATYLSTTRIGHHASPFSFIGLQSNFDDPYVFAQVVNRKGSGPADVVLMSTVQACVPA